MAEQNKPPYRSYSRYLKDLYGETTYRVGVDGGFSCPHRTANRRSGGCTFCDEHGSRASYQRDSNGMRPGVHLDKRIELVREQVENGLVFLRRRYKTNSFILYFQAFSSTYGNGAELKTIYDAGLSVHPFRELIISTRPDCVDDKTAELLGSYVKGGLPVWVELGLQSASDSTLARINRGHTVECFDQALNTLRERGILVAAHIIFGLPGEGEPEITHTVDYLAARKIDGIKIHDLHIPRSSPLLSEYLRGELALLSERRHLAYVVSALERLPEDTVIMRLTCDTPEATRALPIHPPAKERFIRHVTEELERRCSRQGVKLYR